MGLFGFIKSINEEKKKIKKHQEMSIDELKQLDNDELMEALQNRMLHEEEKMDVEECLHTFENTKRVFYIVNYFDMEVQNGGLCQYFVNSSRLTAPYILECLHTIQATSYEMLLKNFIMKHQISLNDLSSFIIDDVDEYEKQFERYPFDDFDDAYYQCYENDPLEKYLLDYSKEHLNDFEN